MKMFNKILRTVLVLSVILGVVCLATSCGVIDGLFGHTHNLTAVERIDATCTEAGQEVYFTCDGCEQLFADAEGKNAIEAPVVIAALGHNMVTKSDDNHHWTECDREGCDEATEKAAHLAASISATSKLETPMESVTVAASDLTVTATCQCGYSFTVTDGIELENATLVLGENTVTVKYGELSTTVSIMAEKFSIILGGTVSDNTYVSSSSKTKDNTSATELKAYSDAFRVYFRVNIKDAISDDLFDASKAKVQLTLTIINEGTLEETKLSYNGVSPDKVYTLKAYKDTGVVFSDINWNSVSGTDIHWGNGKGLVSNEAGSNITVADGKITITVAYSHLADCVDENGNIILAFASQNAKSLSVASISNEGSEPTVKVLINEDTVHVFDQENADEKYFASAKCTETAKYYKSCSCGEMCFVTFNYGDVIDHEFGDWTTTKEATCTEAGKETRACANCIKTETQTIEALDHDMKLASDDSYHWEECDREGCDVKTEGVAHFGGTATEEKQAECEICGKEYGGLASHVHSHGNEWKSDETHHWKVCSCGDVADKAEHFGGEATETEKAVCTTCGQPYGELKTPEPTEVTVAGTIVQDTYVDSGSGNKDKDFTAKDTLNTYSSNYRSYIRVDLKNALESESFNAGNAKVQLVLTVTTSDVLTEATTFTLKTYAPTEGLTDIDLAKINWNSVNNKTGSEGEYSGLNWNSGTELAKVDYTSVENGKITITLDYSAIADYVDTNGNILFAFGSNTSGLKIASKENTEFDVPAVSVTYTK